MNINCVFQCTHQKDGKCCLNRPKTMSFFLLEEPSCPYFEKTVPRTKQTH